MCQAPIDTTWSFVGPYASGTGIVLQFTSGAFGGSFDGQIQISGGFPTWTLNFEDAGDNDFNDFILDVQAFSPDTLFSISLSADTTELHPWIPQLSVNGLPQSLRPGDTATFAVSAAVWATYEEEVEVSVSAEFINGSGGHVHTTSRVPLDEMPNAQNGAPVFGDLVGNPWGGFFQYDEEQHDSFEAETTDGALEFSFVAGVLGGEMDVILEATVDSIAYADTVRLLIRVPGLINDTTEISDVVLFVGGTPLVGGPPIHPQGVNHHVTPSVAERMGRIASAMAMFAGPNRYLQHNDASLPWGGAFTVNPDAGGTGEWPLKGHQAHALGVDIDIAWCYAAVAGFTANQTGRVGGTSCTSTSRVNLERLQSIADADSACADAHPSIAGGPDDHFHIRFTGSCQG